MKYRSIKTDVEIGIEKERELKNKKAWIADLRGYESAWTTRGGGVYSLGGQSLTPLPSNVYKITTDGYGDLLYIAINIVGDDLIKLPDSKTDEILQGIETFWNNKEKYELFGQVHKRGILLHGKQGTGKSATLDLLFNQILARGGVVIIVDNPSLAIAAVQRLRMIEPDRPLILLYEDIDSLFEEYGESNLLSMMDGQLQFSNTLHIATTNYIDKIPARLKNRPSRFDEVIEILPPTLRERDLFINHLMRVVEDKSKILEMVRDTEGLALSHIKELVISVYLLNRDYNETLNRLRLMNKDDN